MATVPTVPDFSQYDFALGDTGEAITKQNGQNKALIAFGNSLRAMTQSLNDDVSQVDSDKTAAAQSAAEAESFRDQSQAIKETGLPDKSGNAGRVLRVAADESGYVLGSFLPVGEIKMFPAANAPKGFLKTNGAELSRTTYAALWEFAQSSGNLHAQSGKPDFMFGEGDGSTTFTLPDHRGEFPRFWDDGRGVDNGRGIGDFQGDQNKSHNHSASSGSAGKHSHSASSGYDGSHSHSASASSSGGHRHKAYTNHSEGDGGRRATSIKVSPFSDTPDDIIGADDSMSYEGNHSHSISVNSTGNHNHSVSVNSNGNHNHSVSVQSSGGDENRPRNVALLSCIRY